MERMLIGSRAIKYHFPDFREPDDTDYFSKTAVPDAECFWHHTLESYQGGPIATPDEMYTVKMSHIFWDIKWSKHVGDIMFLQSKGAKLVPELYDILYPLWVERNGRKKVNLNMSPADFFNSRVVRVYDHDSIHRSIAYYDRPLYESILRDGHEVAVSRNKFETLPFEDKLKLVREEVYATALERQIIPSDYTFSPRSAYNWALKKTIIDFSKGWFPLFIGENLLQLRKPDVDYVQVHLANKERLIKL